MKDSWFRLGSAVMFLSLIFPGPAPAQQAVGIVTALKGKGHLTRSGTQKGLQFKDDVILRDLIDTREKSLARILFGGKSTVTVRELSRLEVREENLPTGAVRSVHELSSGGILVHVARSLLRPGDEVQIRTPNAVAAVRGTTIFAQFIPQLARTVFTVLTGSAIVTPQGLPAISLTPNTAVNVTGDQSGGGVQAGPVQVVSQSAGDAILQESEAGVAITDGAEQEQAEAQTNQAVQLASAVVEAVTGQASTTSPETRQLAEQTAEQIESATAEPKTTTTSTAPTNVNPTADETAATAQEQATSVSSVLKNPGFETGDFSDWTLTGAGSVVKSLGSITTPQGTFMALIHTGTGSVETGGPTTFSESDLSQSFTVASTLLIKFDYNFLTDEFKDSLPENDFFEVTLTDSLGNETLLVKETALGSTFTALDQDINGDGFKLTSAAGGQTGFISASKTVVIPSGTATIEFEVADIGDAIVDSVALFDAVSITLDPPLFLVRDGQTLVGPASEPLIRFSDRSLTFDSALIACCPGANGPSSVSLSGPLLEAERSDLTVPFSMVGLLEGSTLTTTSSEPLVSLRDGNYALSTIDGTAIFDFWGAKTGVDPDTGVLVGTGKTVQHGGPLLEASSAAAVDTAKVLKLDTALLEATAPVIRLVGSDDARSSLTSGGATIDLIKSKATSVGPVVALDKGLINVTSGPLINLTRGSHMEVSGDLLSLTNGSKINVVNGPLVAVSGNGSLLDVSGALASFGGTGGNRIVVNNDIAPTATLSGLPVNTATGGSVTIGPSPIKNPDLGSVSVTGSLIQATKNGSVNIAAP